MIPSMKTVLRVSHHGLMMRSTWHPLRRGRRCSGMSVLEVLIALGIVALLVILTLQGTRALTEGSRSVACIAKLRNLHVIYSAFRADYRDRLYQGTQTYIPVLYLSGGLKDASETRCPSTIAGGADTFKIGSFLGAPGEVVLGWVNQPIGYAINSFLFYQNSYPKHFVPQVKHLSAFVGHESKTPLFMDGRVYGLNQGAWDGEKRLDRLAFRHGGRANILFLDGHVESVSREEALLLDPLPL